MTENRKPIKTEYKNIVFDSKSEAIFARCLDLSGNRWRYHVNYCSHEWDFEIDAIKVTDGIKSYVSSMLVEYKPRSPTETYVQNLIEKMNTHRPRESIVVFGSAYEMINHDRYYGIWPVISNWDSKYGRGDYLRFAEGYPPTGSHRHNIYDMLGISNSIVEEAREFRFDLEFHFDYVTEKEFLNREEIEIGAYDDEHGHRVARLKKMISHLGKFGIDKKSIVKLYDRKGCLTVTWKDAASEKKYLLPVSICWEVYGLECRSNVSSEVA